MQPHLSPEYKRSLEVFRETLPEWQRYFSKSCMNIPLEQNYKQFFTTPIKKQYLPRSGSGWYWNQSNSQIQVTIMNRFLVKICKYNTRKTSPDDVAPSYKVWAFSAFVLDTNERFYFVWCEKGPIDGPLCIKEPIEQEQKSQTSITASSVDGTFEQLTVASLSFLSPFADKETIASLGW